MLVEEVEEELPEGVPATPRNVLSSFAAPYFPLPALFPRYLHLIAFLQLDSRKSSARNGAMARDIIAAVSNAVWQAMGHQSPHAEARGNGLCTLLVGILERGVR